MEKLIRELRFNDAFEGVFMVGDDDKDVSGRFGSMNWKAEADEVDDWLSCLSCPLYPESIDEESWRGIFSPSMMNSDGLVPGESKLSSFL